MKKLTTDEFLKNFYLKYPNGLNLDLSQFEYVTAKQKSTTYCNIHRCEILNTADALMQGFKKCKYCKSEAISRAQSYTYENFLEKAITAHGDNYDYSETRWVDSRTNIFIKCKIHGVFEQNPQSHWKGYGCPKCGYQNLRKGQEKFIIESKIVHGNKYSYNKVNYINNYTPVIIECQLHGEFNATSKDHIIYQRGCPECYPGNRSWAEIEWLNQLSIPKECRQKTLIINGKRIIVDAIVDTTIYEFWGDFWHGNPKIFLPDNKNTKCNKTFKELYEKTMEKRELILNAGYNLIEIWESDFRKGKL